jgi:hypothetical protein
MFLLIVPLEEVNSGFFKIPEPRADIGSGTKSLVNIWLPARI